MVKVHIFAMRPGAARTAAHASAAALLPVLFAAGSASARAHSVDPMDWLVQHICADAADRPIAVDPYEGCGSGATERRLRLDDPMPYLRHDLPGKAGDHPNGFQRLDSHPIIDVYSKAIIVANDYDFDYVEPYGPMHPGDGDGFEVYRVADGYTSGGGARDGSGYSQTFFGPGCKPYGGWVFFPAGFLRSLRSGAAGRGICPIRDVYWEQNGEPWPGSCRSGPGFATDTLTTWEFAPAHPFGGVNGTVAKHIDAIVSTHGLPMQRGPRSQFHLERFYFTDLYGLTRWEAWVPSSNPTKVTENCAGDTEMTYEGISFIVADCRDWSMVQLINPPRPRWPWPYPETNLLRNWHFDDDTVAPCQLTGAKSGPSNVMSLSQSLSRAPADLRFSQTHIGVRYLQVGCGTRPCFPDEAISQTYL